MGCCLNANKKYNDVDRRQSPISCTLQLSYLVAAKNLTPSPSATSIICARLDRARIVIARRKSGIGMPESGDGTGGSEIS